MNDDDNINNPAEENGTSASETTAPPSDHEDENSALTTSDIGKNLSANFPASQGLNALVNTDMIYYERLPMLEVVFDRLVRLISISLRNFTSENVDVALESLTSVRFGDYIESMPTPCMINVFLAKQWDNHGLLMVDSDLIYVMIDVLLGGRKGTAPQRRDNRVFTTIECNLVSRLIELVLSELSSAFDPISPIDFIYERVETNPAFASIARAANAIVLVRLSVDVDKRGGFLELALPYATLEPIRDLLLQNFMGEKFGRDPIWEDHLAHQLMDTELDLCAVLEPVYLPLQDVLAWDVGSQVLLTATPDSLVSLVCQDYPLFRGKMGQKLGNIAIKIESDLNYRRDGAL